MYGPDPGIFSFEQGIIEGSERRLEEFRNEHFVMFENAKTAVVPGDPSEEIINYAHAEKIDAIIMGTHGRKGLSKTVFGSVADRVVKGAPVPVLVVNPYKTIN